ncbi:hypothetical protein [Gandjariella thermophila]|uniref:Uncharacterized protein n=1 Tax=Gandjariella thermophila TaxID=1931992 RepID=A0A4D4JHA1_9PSEU|nr:hypothetical protein [Gandjariella thermophila]GDY33669.1 hypothetical protein GTS_53020 [Gandjariella thermophila]
MTETSATKELLRETARRLGTPVWHRVRPHVEAIVARQVEARNRQLLDELRQMSLADEAARAELDRLCGRVAWTENELRRMSAHLAALDERLAAMERPPAVPEQGGADQAEARALIDEIRGEHARVRARLTAIARYEERIGRLEAALAGRDTATHTTG